jgi:hypothetical protein
MEPSKKSTAKAISAFEAADQILSNMMSGKENLPPKKATKIVDISDVKVPDSLVESIMGFVEDTKNSEPQVQEEASELNEEVILESKVNDLVTRLSSLLKEARVVLEEMTSAGMIGTNQKFVLNKKKKNGSTKVIKRN